VQEWAAIQAFSAYTAAKKKKKRGERPMHTAASWASQSGLNLPGEARDLLTRTPQLVVARSRARWSLLRSRPPSIPSRAT
jgi:hypothetical protein